jgi:hypothetical protein
VHRPTIQLTGDMKQEGSTGTTTRQQTFSYTHKTNCHLEARCQSVFVSLVCTNITHTLPCTHLQVAEGAGTQAPEHAKHNLLQQCLLPDLCHS